MAATVRLKNIGQGDRDIRPFGIFEPLASVPAGAEVEVGAELGASLAQQSDVWQIVEAPSGEKVKG